MNSDPEVQEINIIPKADTEILIKEYTRDYKGEKEITKCVLMKVEREKLLEAEYFRAMFGHGRWLESGSRKITLERRTTARAWKFSCAAFTAPLMTCLLIQLLLPGRGTL